MHTSQPLTRSTILLATFVVTVAAFALAADDANTSSETEQELLAVLRADSSAGEKAITCKRLAIHGSKAAVPELAKLLPDPQLSSWARIALEAIPGPEADAALRDAADSLEGKLLVGTINSIGVRQDTAAVDALAKRLRDKDSDVACAAAVALGRIGNAPATRSLRDALAAAPADVRSAIAEGCVLCAERLHADGKSDDAAAIYDQVRTSDVPKQRIIEATRGAILARNDEGIPLLLELFQSSDKSLFQLGLSTAREFPGGEIDKALAAELENVAPDRAAMMILAMADRPDTVVVSAILQAAKNGAKQSRQAAIATLGRIGDASCLSTLLDAALEADSDLAEAAKTALAGLEGDQIDEQIAARLSTAEGKAYPLLIELVGQRRIEAVPDLLNALDHSDKAVRGAALTALGETVALDRLSVLVAQVVAPKYPEDAEVAQQALRAASVRMPDREACAAELATALGRAPASAKIILMEVLADVGGTKALRTLAAAAKSDDPALQDNGSRLIGKWNSIDAAPVLLDLAKTAPETKYQVRALRGYLGVARKFAMPEPQRVAMCQKAFDTATRLDEQKLALDVLKIHPSAEGLKLAVNAMRRPQLKDAATEAALVIAQKVGGSAEVSQLLAQAGLKKVKLEIVEARYGAGQSQKDVTAVLRKHAGDLQLITLPSSNFNSSFGGDPAPGSVKQLKVNYRIDGKVGDATFEENALIILPVPK